MTKEQVFECLRGKKEKDYFFVVIYECEMYVLVVFWGGDLFYLNPFVKETSFSLLTK